MLRACLLGWSNESKAQSIKQVRIADIVGIWNAVNGGGPRRRQAAPWSSSSVVKEVVKELVVKQLRARSKTRCARMRCSNSLEGSQQRRRSTKVVSKRTTSYVDGSREHKVLRGTALRLRVHIFVLLSLWFDQLRRALGLIDSVHSIHSFPFYNF